MFRVTQPYLNLLVKPIFFFRFSEKKRNFMHFEKRNKIPFKMHKIIYFFQKKKASKKKKKKKKRFVCLIPYLKFQDPLPETHLFFYLALCIMFAYHYNKQYEPRSDCSICSSLIRVHRVCFHGKNSLECSRRHKQMTHSLQACHDNG